MTGQVEVAADPDVPVACSPAETPPLIARAGLLADGVPPVLRLEMLRARGWACVPMEDELEGAAAARLAEACAAYGFTAGWSVEIPWAQDGRLPAAYRFAPSARGFHALSKECYIGSGFVLAEAGGGFAIASDGDLYWMLGAPLPFIERLLGEPIASALQRFGRTAAAYGDTVAGSGLRAVLAVAASASAPA